MGDRIIEVTDADFAEQTKSGFVIVDFWAPWCGPCRMMTPVLEAVAEAYADDLKIVKLNVDTNLATAEKFAVRSIPLLLFLYNGEIFDQIVGAVPRATIEEKVMRGRDRVHRDREAVENQSSKRPVVYLAGGMFGKTDVEASDWRNHATDVLTAAGFDILNPMSRDYRGREGDFSQEIVDGDIADINNSDYVLALAKEPSWGTAMEIRYAWEVGIPVIAVVNPKTSPWLTYHATETCLTLEEALAIIINMAEPLISKA